MTKPREFELYPQVAAWLIQHLKASHPKARVTAYDTHLTDLSGFLRKQKLHQVFKDYDAYEIQVDVTGIVETREAARLAFVECKVGPITLRDVGQLLGYSLVARPAWSYLLSPRGLTDRLSLLLITYGRQDILAYGKGRFIRIAAWNSERAEIDFATLIPKGSHI
jgi:hypothetical protein